MKKLLVLIVIASLTTLANGMLLQISAGGDPDPVDSTIILQEQSGYISLDIWSPDGWLSDADNLYFGLVVSPAMGTITGGVMHIPPAPDGAMMIGDDLSEFFGNPGIYGQLMCYTVGGGPGIFVDGIEFHCEGAGDAVISLITTDFTTYTVHDTLTIHQIPEPATIVLLSLGGLLLRKK
jgi:hypothetical protein